MEEKPQKEKSRRKVVYILLRVTAFPRFKQTSKINYFKKSGTVIVGFWGAIGIFQHLA